MNIATAVAAVKAGALDYLPKPADPDQINAALMQSGYKMPPPQDPKLRMAFAGNIFSGFMNNVGVMYQKQHGGCECIAELCNGF